MSVRTLSSPALILILSFLLGACGRGEQSVDQTGGIQSGGAAPDPSVEQEAAPSQPLIPTQVSVAETELGTVLVSGDGFTLYVLTSDSTNTPGCYGDCTRFWPPLLTDGSPQAGKGIDASKLGVATRQDGTFQVSYFGRPLYLYHGDAAQGDTQGHGIENLWQVLLPSGELLDEAQEGIIEGPPSNSGDEEYNPDDYY